MNEDDVIIDFLPFYHVTGCFLAFFSLIVGARMIYAAKKFSFTGMLRAIQEHKVCIKQ